MWSSLGLLAASRAVQNNEVRPARLKREVDVVLSRGGRAWPSLPRETTVEDRGNGLMYIITKHSRRSRPTVETLEGRALLTAGVLDTSFGGTGQVITQLPSQTFADGAAVQSDLKTVVVGQEGAGANSTWNLALFRYNVDGSLDSTFGNR